MSFIVTRSVASNSFLRDLSHSKSNILYFKEGLLYLTWIVIWSISTILVYFQIKWSLLHLFSKHSIFCCHIHFTQVSHHCESFRRSHQLNYHPDVSFLNTRYNNGKISINASLMCFKMSVGTNEYFITWKMNSSTFSWDYITLNGIWAQVFHHCLGSRNSLTWE